MKFCTVCKQEKNLDDFYFSRTKNAYLPQCKKCMADYQKIYRAARLDKRRTELQRWRRENPDRSRLLERRTKYKKYGLTVEDFDLMLDQQAGKCAICLQPEKVKNKNEKLCCFLLYKINLR